MCRYIYMFLICFVCFSLFSCNEQNKKDIKKMVEEWSYKKIVFPNNPTFTRFAKDTIIGYFEKDCNYKVLTYIDSIGCLRCHLKLNAWKPFIKQLEDTFPECNVLFFIHPMNKKSVEHLLKTENFAYPVCIDEKDSINKLNHFPVEMRFQTLLLDKENKVLAIGNPVQNPKIKELYLKIISGESALMHITEPLTQVEVNKKSIKLDSFDWKQEQTVDFILTNIGKRPLVVENVITSCGCTTVEYSKEPVCSGKNLILTIKYQAEYPEHFDKTITVYCNVKESPLQMRIIGDAK